MGGWMFTSQTNFWEIDKKNLRQRNGNIWKLVKTALTKPRRVHTYVHRRNVWLASDCTKVFKPTLAIGEEIKWGTKGPSAAVTVEIMCGTKTPKLAALPTTHAEEIDNAREEYSWWRYCHPTLLKWKKRRRRRSGMGGFSCVFYNEL